MNSKDQIKKGLAELSLHGIQIIKYLQGKLDKKEEKTFSFHAEYQVWYSKAIKAVASMAEDRLDDFVSYYKINQKRKSLGYGTYVIEDYLKGVVPSHMDFDSKTQTLQNFYNQWTILKAIGDRVDSIFENIISHVTMEFQEDSILMAEELGKVNLRASGALAGVILENHLQTVAKAKGIQISKKNPTISDLNEPLKQGGVYGVPEWRKISYLADIRNICSHKKDVDPTKDQIADLISGVRWATKNVN